MRHATIRRVETNPDSTLPYPAALLIFCIAISMMLAAVMGHDANWDLRNYHLYNAFALLDWRYDRDIMPVGIQTLLNPLLDLPFYGLVRHAGLKIATLAQSIYYGLLVFAALWLNWNIFRSFAQSADRRLERLLLAGLAAAFGATGTATFSQLATTFNEIQIGLLLVSGLAFMASAVAGEERRSIKLGVAGLLFGAAAGFKLTAFVYAPAAVVAVLVALGPREVWRAVLAFGVGGTLGFTVIFGWWGWIVYERFESPLFPFYNGLFQSPFYPPTNFVDDRWGPKTPAEWVAFPFNWAWRMSGEAVEPVMRDPRLALFLLASLFVGLGFWRVVRRVPELSFIAVFGVLAYVIWLVQFSYLRYAIPIEIVSGTLVVAAIALVSQSTTFRLVTAALVLVCAQLATAYPAWERIEFSEDRYAFELPNVPPGSMIVLQAPPAGFILPFIEADDLTFVNGGHLAGETRGYGLFEAIRARISAHSGLVFVLTRGSMDEAILAELGLRAAADTCQSIRTNIEPLANDINLCVATKA